MAGLTKGERRTISALVRHYKKPEVQEPVKSFMDAMQARIVNSGDLSKVIHTLKWRVKSPESLRHKLQRQFIRAKERGRPFGIEPKNLLSKITDLAGIRVLHLRTEQIVEIDRGLREVIGREGLRLLEKPFARTWDDEFRERFRQFGFKTEVSPSMYTSVHYLIGSASASGVACEVQVRTLMEEVWGEVDHDLNYPRRCNSLPCREQIRVLARVVSSGTRLVDAIYTTWLLEEKRRSGRRKS